MFAKLRTIQLFLPMDFLHNFVCIDQEATDPETLHTPIDIHDGDEDTQEFSLRLKPKR